MNLSLSDEQEALRDAARDALGRVPSVAAAREALEGGALPDLWQTTAEAGWAGLLIEEDRGGAGLGLFDAMLIAQEAGRALAPVPLLSLLPATLLLDAAADEQCAEVAAGERRVAWLPSRPPTDADPRWTSAARRGRRGTDLPAATVESSGNGAGDVVALSGEVCWVPDAVGASLLVAAGCGPDGEPVLVALEADAEGVSIEGVHRYDATRPLAHVRLDGARGRRLGADAGDLERAWDVAQALVAAEAVGTVQTLLDTSVAYAKERFTFGRAIGSYQAVKHALVEVLRQQENATSLLYYVGYASTDAPHELALAANAARSAAGHALEQATRTSISVHGGIGATWEHDAPLFFRRAQLTRRLLGGTAGASDRVAQELLAGRGGPIGAGTPDEAALDPAGTGA